MIDCIRVTFPCDFESTMAAAVQEAYADKPKRLNKRQKAKVDRFIGDNSRRGLRQKNVLHERFQDQAEALGLEYGSAAWWEWVKANWPAILKIILSILAMFLL